MANVGLLYVGAVLFLNGLMLLGVVSGKAAGILNFFVGGMQVVFPTIALMQAQGDPDAVFAAAGIYLFGFTYLYVGLIQWTGHGGEGLGWFSLFVAISAVVIALAQFAIYADPLFGVIWLLWAVLWSLFFVLLGLKVDRIGRMTGWFTIFVSFITATIPALLALTGTLPDDPMWAAVLAVVGVASFVVAVVLRGSPVPATDPAPAES
ncbi:AmiS/UreI family transporter [Microbacterium halotolerans]|uniref:AmiS/UreI family transporter n=1 Tax=Microbacterium halotolerans TaxID=246613 RepID=UPI000E6AC9C3|nr:AmiS/UreI family transporter [Microbacterium halotolerans]